MNPTLFKVGLSKNASKIIARLSDRPGLTETVKKTMDSENAELVLSIKQKIGGSAVKGLRGSQVLHYRSGRLSSSIGNSPAHVVNSDNSIVVQSAVGSGVGFGKEAVRYAAIHEFGGIIHIPSRPRKPRNKKSRYLKSNSMTPAAWLQTKAYDIHMPERSYIRSTYRERANRYSTQLSIAALRFLKGANN